MSPSEIARAVRLRLAAELADDRAALDAIARSVAALCAPAKDPADEWMRVLALAFQVERWYTAVEATLTRLLRTLDGDVPAGPAWHQEILRAASVAIDEGRPAILSRQTVGPLTELLKLRHLARHGYETEPELARMLDHAGRVEDAQAALGPDLDALAAWLKA